MTLKSVRRMTALACSATLLGATFVGGCVPLRSHQGYIVDTDLINSVQPGVDTRQSVLTVLGKPTFAAEFDQGDWYYISRDARNYAFNNPHVRDQFTLRISFDARGVVSAVRRSGAEQVAAISPSSKVTPTLGKKRSFFDELFGNIGTVVAGTARRPHRPPRCAHQRIVKSTWSTMRPLGSVKARRCRPGGAKISGSPSAAPISRRSSHSRCWPAAPDTATASL